MKKIIVTALLLPLLALAQTYPSPTFNSVTLQNPLSAPNGGTGVVNSSTITLGGNLTTFGANPLTLTTTGTTNITLPTSGTILSNITGVAAGANSNITSLSGLTTPLSVPQGGTGSTVEGCPSIMAHGGNNAGSVDNSTAFSNTIAANPTGQICVYFPPGTYAFSSQQIYTLPNANAAITIKGAGSDVSILNWAAGGGLRINYVGVNNSAHISDLTLSTGTTSSGNAIDLRTTVIGQNPEPDSLSDITRVSIRGSDGYAKTNYWATGINIYGVSNINIAGTTIYGAAPSSGGYSSVGTGINVSGASTIVPTVYNVSNSVINYVSSGFVYGTYTQGVTITTTNFTGDNYGIVSPGGESALEQLHVSGSQFNCGLAAINLSTKVPDTSIIGNLFLIPSSASGISLTGSPGQYTIVGNTFDPASGGATSSVGIVINNSAGPGIITGNSFASLSTAIALQGASTLVNVQSNVYQSNTTNIANSGTSNTIGGGSQ